MEQVTLVQQVLAVLAGVIVGFSPLPDRRGWLDPCRAAHGLRNEIHNAPRSASRQLFVASLFLPFFEELSTKTLFGN